MVILGLEFNLYCRTCGNAETLVDFLSSALIVQCLQALWDCASAVYFNWFEWEKIPPRKSAEDSDYFQKTSAEFNFDIWSDEVLGRNCITYFDGNGSWGSPRANICYLKVLSGDTLSWSTVPSAVAQSEIVLYMGMMTGISFCSIITSYCSSQWYK